ncbi:MAG TPA: hypothetical protein VNZ55_09735 [Thermomicrobiales bacterium]|nr:hypothetical protein [Thermomicrobiales bacterium]
MNPLSRHVLSRRLDRRRFVLAPVVGALAIQPMSHAFATQSHDHATPDTATVDADVVWTWTDDGVEISSPIAAGWNRVSIVNNRSADMPSTHVLTLRLPDDATDAQVEELTTDGAPFPDWARECYYPGIPDGVAPGETLTGYTWYAEGQYLWGDIFSDLHGDFTVGPGSWNRPHPAPDVRVEMVEMAFLGLEKPLAPGKFLWDIGNRGATWHEMVILQTAEPMTADEALDAMMNDENWPPAGITLRAGYGITSPGMSGMIELDLEAGSYIAACMAPDNFDGPPHAIVGMIQPFVVE